MLYTATYIGSHLVYKQQVPQETGVGGGGGGGGGATYVRVCLYVTFFLFQLLQLQATQPGGTVNNSFGLGTSGLGGGLAVGGGPAGSE